MPSAPPAPTPAALPVPGTTVGTGRLAAAFQETLTAVARLRADRQPVSDAAAFRAHLLQLLARADADARAAGYDPGDVRIASFAVVALLDESVLNARQPALADWARRPLQEELFGNHMAGEWFYQHVEQLLARPDAAPLADLLELHQLCLLLGFRGRYGAHDPGALHAVTSRIGERVARLRVGLPQLPAHELAPAWRPPDDAVATRDPWLVPLAGGLVAALVLALGLWGAGATLLRRPLAALDAPAAQATPAAQAPAS